MKDRKIGKVSSTTFNSISKNKVRFVSRFQVIKSKRSEMNFVISGILLEGEIMTGMNILVPLNPSLNMVGEINSIIEVNNMELRLVVICEDIEEAELWEGLQINNEIIEIV